MNINPRYKGVSVPSRTRRIASIVSCTLTEWEVYKYVWKPTIKNETHQNQGGRIQETSIDVKGMSQTRKENNQPTFFFIDVRNPLSPLFTFTCHNGTSHKPTVITPVVL